MTNIIKTIIFIRHGQTTDDKNDPNRSLTNAGITLVSKTCNQISQEINLFPVEIISTNTVRAIQTAQILSDYLKIKYRQDLSLKASAFLIKEWNYIRQIKSQNIKYSSSDLTYIYLSLAENNKLPANIKRPFQVANQFIKFIKSIKSDAKTLIFIANGGSIEAASYYQKYYLPDKNDIVNKRILDYSEYLILTKKRNSK